MASGSGSAADCVERATSDLLIGPDWAINIELCDIINRDPGQAKDVTKILKKHLGSKNPKIQLLSLFVSAGDSQKNCGDSVIEQIAEHDILHEMVKIVKKKPDLNLREKILILIDTWQDALGGSSRKYPQYYAAYQELLSAGVEFPPRVGNNVPLFTPPQTHPIVRPEASTCENAAIGTPVWPDASSLSLMDIKKARGISELLMEILSALDPHSSEDVKQEVLVDLVEQCQSYQKQVVLLVSNTGDEELLHQGLTLNEELQHVLQQYDDLVRLTSTKVVQTTANSTLVHVNPDDDESEDGFSRLMHRTSREQSAVQSRKPSIPTKQNGSISPGLPFPPPPPPSPPPKTPSNLVSDKVDYLSGDVYGSESPSSGHSSTSPLPTVSLSPHKDRQPPISLPPPPSKYTQRQKFFEQQQLTSFGRNSGISYNGLVKNTQNLSLQQSKTSSSQQQDPCHPGGQDLYPSTRHAKPSHTLFKDLVDFAKTRLSASKPGGHETSY